MAADETQPQPELRDDGQVAVFCDRKGYAGVSAVIGDKQAVVQWIGDLCEVADIEFDDTELPDKIVISIPPGA